MMWRVHHSIVLFLIIAPVFLARASSAPPLESEAQLLARVEKEQDPVKKSKLESRLARLKLQQAIKIYEQGNTEQGDQLISAYLARIKDAWQVLRSSGRNAAHASRGFKELDIELREDARLLDDLKRRISYFDRGPVERAQKEVEQERAEVLHALFPVTRAPEAAKALDKTD
jgi:CRISPR/Cas system-associated endonuclease Cas1